MKRTARVKAMQILYIMDFNQVGIDEAIAMQEEPDELANHMAMLCISHLEQIDELISTTLQNYSLDRLNLVDKAIIRLAVSEMIANEPKEIVINEALEITKEYSDEGNHKATSFNNRLLDNISKKI